LTSGQKLGDITEIDFQTANRFKKILSCFFYQKVYKQQNFNST